MLSVVCIENLAARHQLGKQFGLWFDSGLQSLDEGEQKLWKDSIMAGKSFTINRGINGGPIVNTSAVRWNEISQLLVGGVKDGWS